MAKGPGWNPVDATTLDEAKLALDALDATKAEREQALSTLRLHGWK